MEIKDSVTSLLAWGVENENASVLIETDSQASIDAFAVEMFGRLVARGEPFTLHRSIMLTQFELLSVTFTLVIDIESAKDVLKDTYLDHHVLLGDGASPMPRAVI
jgi:hypothetical protein